MIIEKLFSKITVSIALGVFALLGTYSNIASFYFMLLAFTSVCTFEYCKAYKKNIFYIGDFFTLIAATLIITINFLATDLVTSLLLMLVILLAYPVSAVINKRYDFWVFGGLIYFTFPMTLMLYYWQIPDFGKSMILFILLICWLSDFFALIIGKTVKGPKMGVHINVKKHWSGFFGSAICCGILFTPFLMYFIPGMTIFKSFIWALFVSFGVNIGDIFASAIKRRLKITDFSNFLPGFGGFLDRLDGHFFAAIFNLIPLKLFLS